MIYKWHRKSGVSLQNVVKEVEQKVVLRCCVRAALQEARLLQKRLFFERFSNACPEPVLVTFRILVVVQWHRNKDVFRTEGWKSTV
jgi:hypothetical protein